MNLSREGPGVADVYILCLEEFRSVGMLPPEGSSMFRKLPPGTFTTSGLRTVLISGYTLQKTRMVGQEVPYLLCPSMLRSG
jgi:hypothetical protein